MPLSAYNSGMNESETLWSNPGRNLLKFSKYPEPLESLTLVSGPHPLRILSRPRESI